MTVGVKSLSTPLIRLGNRASDYLSLLKPELTGLSVFTALFGTFLAQSDQLDLRPFMVVLAGTLMVGGGAGSLNQFIERDQDALMKRTERRPLPSGRLLPVEALSLGTLLAVTGILLLLVAGNTLSGILALITFAMYVFLYTPLKRWTPAATFIGGIPGALPPVIGWTVVRGSISIEPVILFLILFAWQMPHFYSLAWLYRKDYARAGFSTLTVTDHRGRKTALRMLLYSTLLVGLAPAAFWTGMIGLFSLTVATLLGSGMLLLSWRFYRFLWYTSAEAGEKRLNVLARQIFFASLMYLPLLILGIAVETI